MVVEASKAQPRAITLFQIQDDAYFHAKMVKMIPHQARRHAYQPYFGAEPVNRLDPTSQVARRAVDPCVKFHLSSTSTHPAGQAPPRPSPRYQYCLVARNT
jgi:hypothetical protein